MISVHNLKHSYKKSGRSVLEISQLKLEAQGVIGILGHNGSGKSSLLSCIAGVMKPREGQVRLQGRDTWRFYEDIKQEVQLLSDAIPLFQTETGWQLIRLLKGLAPQWNQELEDELVASFGIPLDEPTAHLSRGERTKLKLLLCLCQNPRVVLIDELTNDLDGETRRAVFQRLDAFSFDQEATVLVATNIVHDMERFANHIVLLGEGRVLANEDLDQLKERFKRIALRRGPSYQGSSLKHIQHDTLQWDGQTGRVSCSRFDPQIMTALAEAGVETQLEPYPLEDIVTQLGGTFQ